MNRPGWMSVLALAFALIAVPVFGQGGSTSATLTGVVKDKDGAVPGATVVIKNMATGAELAPVVTNESGTYSFPGLAPGVYKVTITMQNYKTVELEARLNSGSTTTVPTMLELGRREEVVNVTSSTASRRGTTSEKKPSVACSRLLLVMPSIVMLN